MLLSLNPMLGFIKDFGDSWWQCCQLLPCELEPFLLFVCTLINTSYHSILIPCINMKRLLWVRWVAGFRSLCLQQPMTADKMENEEKLICCKQKGCERSWVSKSECTYQQYRTHKLYSIILYVQAFQFLSTEFQGGCVTHASIGKRKRKQIRVKNLTLWWKARSEYYDVIFLYWEGYYCT